MTAPTLWIEITIAGALYVAALCFLILAGFGVRDARVLEAVKEYLPYLSACAIAASYIAGVVAHRIVQVLAPPVLARIERLFGIAELTDRGAPDKVLGNMVAIWQRGSERLHRELDFQYALVALLRSLLFSVPILGFSIALWLMRAERSGIWLPILFVVTFWPVSLTAYRRQWSQYRTIRAAALAEIERVASIPGASA